MKRNLLISTLAALALSLACAQGARAQATNLDGSKTALDGSKSAAALAAREEVRPAGGIATLYALDPLASSLCLADGRDGYVFQQNEVRNRCSDLDFGNYSAGGFSVGVEGARRGRIIDLGDADALELRYGFRDTVGKAQGFASLHAKGGKVFVLKSRQPQTFQELKESGELYADGEVKANVPVKVGHIYLIRITDDHDKGFQRLAKVKVISYVPGESVTIRWQPL
ncbi:MAG TPA: hypothetical protein VJ866_08070 [Pyrinomonadaceae bacterium]|nr:hypothetical protein [Pyrinomonadaceae bacterium]